VVGGWPSGEKHDLAWDEGARNLTFKLVVVPPARKSSQRHAQFSCPAWLIPERCVETDTHIHTVASLHNYGTVASLITSKKKIELVAT